jgi:hypothetical protein
MHVLEESDHAIVPMKRLNKEGQPSTEAVEGRAWPKENIARSDTFPTQSGRMRVPQVGRCAAGSLPPASEGGAVCANERPYGSARGVPGDRYPYRDWLSALLLAELEWRRKWKTTRKPMRYMAG